MIDTLFVKIKINLVTFILSLLKFPSQFMILSHNFNSISWEYLETLWSLINYLQAACGIAHLIVRALMKSGLSKAQAAKRIYMFDKDGLVTMVRIFLILHKDSISSTISLIGFYNLEIFIVGKEWFFREKKASENRKHFLWWQKFVELMSKDSKILMTSLFILIESVRCTKYATRTKVICTWQWSN